MPSHQQLQGALEVRLVPVVPGNETDRTSASVQGNDSNPQEEAELMTQPQLLNPPHCD